MDIKYSLDFQTAEQRKQAIEDVLNMKSENRGWAVIREVLRNAIEDTKKKILDPPDGTAEDVIDKLRVRLKVQERLYNLPDLLVDNWTQTPFGDVPDVDPYGKVEAS